MLITTDPLVGRRIGQYEIVARLGGGGMGVVYKARDSRLGRSVALKFLPQQWSDDEAAKQRFVREAQAASATEHPNICTIHDIDSADDGRLFIVMAYYEGQTLKQRLESGPLPLDEALEIATQVAEGLAKAHAQGVVHRDVKPANLMLTDDGVRIVDFGLAKFADTVQLTVVGSTMGTAAYMSPEQVQGKETDARSDVWALGVVLYEMLAGHPPFRGTYAEAISYAIRTEAPAPLRDARAEIPEEVEQIVFRALHKDPAVRFQSGREVARALRQARGLTVPLDLRTQVVPVPPAASVRQGRPSLRRWLIVAALLAVIVAGGAWWLLRPVTRLPVLVLPVANQTGFAEIDPYRRALTQVLLQELSDSSDIRAMSWPRMLQTLRALIGEGVDMSSLKAAEALRASDPSQPIVVTTLLHEDRLWRVRVEIKDPGSNLNDQIYESAPVTSALPRDTAYRLMAAAAREIEAHFNRRWWRPTSSEPRPLTRFASVDAARGFEEGINWIEEGEYASARGAFERAAKADSQSALIRGWESRALRLMRNDAAAADSARQAVQLLTEDVPRADRWFIEATAAEARGDLAAAAVRYRDLASRYPDDAIWLSEVAAFEERRADTREGWEAAIAAYHDVLALDPGLLRPQLELCRLYTRLQDTQSAVKWGRQALSGYQQARWSGGEALARFCLVDLLRGGTEDEQREAQMHADAARVILTRLGFGYNLPRADYYAGLAAANQGRLTAAIALWEQSVGAADQTGNIALQPLLFNNLGLAHHLLGNAGRAVDYYSRSADLYARLGNQRGAASQQLNSAALRLTYGIDTDQAKRELENAVTVTRLLGDADNEAAGLSILAEHHRYAGRLDEAQRALNQSLDLARRHNLDLRIASASLGLARVFFAQSDYPGTLELVTPLADTRTDRIATQSQILAGRACVRLGDFATAARFFERAAADLERRNDTGLRPSLNEALGELAYESDRLAEARKHFAAAAAGAGAEFVEDAVVSSQGWTGFLEALDGRHRAGWAAVTAALAHAEKMQRQALATALRVSLIRMALVAGRPADAAPVIAALPASSNVSGVELKASVEYWRAQAAGGDAAAAAGARRMLEAFRSALPEAYRGTFGVRRDIRLMLE